MLVVVTSKNQLVCFLVDGIEYCNGYNLLFISLNLVEYEAILRILSVKNVGLNTTQ
jgi:hypothetical protein